jgi:excisionase family DNA binding protein
VVRRSHHEESGGDLAWLTAPEVAAVLGVTPEAVRAHVRAGRLRAYRLGGGPRARMRIPSAALAEFLRDAAPRAETR